MKKIDLALAYQQQGFSVIPVQRNKKPYVQWVRFQSEKASPAQIREWWSQWPDANIGIVTGKISGLTVVDVDSKAGMDALNQHLPDTLTTPSARTPSGGWHFYFKHRNGLVNRSRVIKDCDIRTDGGYIVAPGSIGENGKPYRWLSDLSLDSTPLGDMPEPLFSVLRQTERKTDTTCNLSFKKGSRNSTLFHILNGLAIGGEAESNLRQIGLQIGKAFVPPLPEKEILSTVESVLKRKKSQAKDIPSIRPISAKELMTMDLPEPKWIIPGIVVEGLTFLVGKPKHGKSIAVLNIGLSVASGGKALGAIDVEQGTTIYLALEDVPRRLRDRIRQMLVDGAAPEKLMLFTEWPRIGEGGLARLEEEIAQYPDIRLVIIDTLQMIKPPNNTRKSVYEHDYDAVAAIKKRIADRFKIAVILVHHLRKSIAEDVFDTVSGSLGLTGAADSTIILQRITGQADAIMHVTGRDVESREYALSFHPSILSWYLLGDAEAIKNTDNQQAVYDCIKESDNPISPKEIRESTGLDNRTVHRALKALQKDGSIKRAERGMYVPLSQAS